MDEIAEEVLLGAWGTGKVRESRLKKTGYNYADVQSVVNVLVAKNSKATSTKVETSDSSDPIKRLNERKINTVLGIIHLERDS